jgi:hypothetical protein
MSPDEGREQEPYEAPEVEEMPTEDGPAVTSAGKSPGDDGGPGAEWQPDEHAGDRDA